MGIIIPKESSSQPAESDFGDNIAVLPPTTERPAGGPDAYMLNRADFVHRDMPKVDGARDARYQVVFRQSVIDEIHTHGKSSMEAEVCGVLVGDVYFDRLAGWAHVEHCIRGDTAVGKQTQVTFTSETWTRIHETLETRYPGKKIIGWYHTHPGFGIFLSGMDLFIQDNFFNQPWQFATVYDPHSGDEGTFIWRAGKSLRENILIENDTGVDPAAKAAPLDAVAELTNRVKRLERRIDFILTGFLFLVLIALVVPLILLALAPDTMKKLPTLERSLLNAISHPGDKPAAPATSQPAASGPANSVKHSPGTSGGPATPTGPGSDERLLRADPPTEDPATGGSKTLTPKPAK